MFPDSAVAAGFKCCRTKANYTINDGISVDIQEKFIQSLQNVPFSLLIDESNKQYGKKFLCVMIKFYDSNYNDITVRFLDLCVCNNGTSDEITKHVVDIIRNNNLSFENLIHLMTDNPNVMRGCFNGVVTQIKNEHANHLADIGGCSLHLTANVVKNSLPELYLCDDIEDFLQDISAFFSFHVEFAELFSEIQAIYSLEKHQLLRYCVIRFSSIYPVVEKTVLQYKAIKKMFLDDIPKNYKKVAKQARVIRIQSALNNKYTLPTLHFILNALEIFHKYEKKFQNKLISFEQHCYILSI